MFTWLYPLLTTLLLASWSDVAHACKCAEPKGPSDALASAQAVFQGEVSAIRESGEDLIVTLRVPKAWKGIVSAEQVRVRTRKDSAACGFRFVQGEHYLVYAQALDPEQDGVALQVLRCGRTRALADAEPDLRELGLGAIPVELHAPHEETEPKSNAVERRRDQPAAGGCASCSAHPARAASRLGISVIAGLGLLLHWRRGRPQRGVKKRRRQHRG